MSTSSVYSSNKLRDVIKNETQHFVIKSYITAAFETERKKTEFHLYWYNRNSSYEIEFGSYHSMSFKKMNKKELALFHSIMHNYSIEIDGQDGTVWHHREIGFNKELVKSYQLKLI